MNVENTWDGRMEADMIEGPIECITEMEAENALNAMKLGKAPGPAGLSSEMLLAAECKGKKLQVDICNLIITEGRRPFDRDLSTLVSIYKGKGDPFRNCL